MSKLNVASKVLSARVTPDVYASWHHIAKSTGRSVSECLRDAAAIVDNNSIVKASEGMIVPDQLNDMLTMVGGTSLVGILVYRGVKAAMTDGIRNKGLQYTDAEVEAVSTILGVCGAVLTGLGIEKALFK